MNIYLADDHQVVRDGLKLLLENAFQEAKIFEAASFSELLAMDIVDLRDNLILCDLKMPGMDSTVGLKAIREKAPDITLVVLSGSYSPDDVDIAIQIGVNGFVAKKSAGASLVNVIHLVLAGETYLPSEWLKSKAEVADRKGEKSTPPKGLTARETEVVTHLAAGLSNKEIAHKLGIEESTIKSHIKNIYEKLGVSNRTQAAKLVMEYQLAQ